MQLADRFGPRLDLPPTVVGVAIVAIGVVQLLSSPPAASPAVMTAAAVVGGLAIAFGRRASVATAVIVATCVVAQVLTDQAPTFSLFVASLAATFMLARYATRTGLVVGLAGLLAAVTAAGVKQGGDLPLELIYPVVYFGGAALAGGWMRRAHRIAEEARTTERIRREQELQLAVSAERTQIARELHDVIAHGVSLMVLQAEGAQAVLDTQPNRVDEALTVIQDTGRSALDELRQLLAVLRRDSGATTEGESSSHPRGISGVGDIAQHARDCGLQVRFTVEGDPAPLPSPVSATAYRVVQEAVTNVVKHAQATSVAIGLSYWPDSLVVSVSDDGRGLGPDDALDRHGLVGMRERVYSCGGDLAIEPSGGGGVTVRAVLPVRT